MTDEQEIWKPITGYEGLYEVSSVGRIRSLRHRSGIPLIMSQSMAHGYLKITLFNGAKRSRGVHVIVCEAFHGPKPEGMEVAHEDGNPINNRSDNLSWKTPVENSADRVRHGTLATGARHGRNTMPERSARGERGGTAKLTSAAVYEIRKQLQQGGTHKGIARLFGVSNFCIKRIHLGTTWRHLT